MGKDKDKLTERQQLFCLYFIKYHIACKAYQAAFDCGYKTAMANSVKLMKRPSIQKEIHRLKQGRLNQAFLSAEDIVEKQIAIAFADITDYVEIVDGKVKIKDTANTDTSVIQEIKETKSGISIKLYDKQKAIEWLEQHMDLLTTYQREKLQIEKESLELRKQQAEKDDW